MTHEALSAAEPKMARALEAMERDFAGIRTGRASTALVERITVDYYGAQTPLNQVAGISTPDPHLIVIQPWDRSVLSAIDKAITRSDIGLVPNVDGTVVRLNVPILSPRTARAMLPGTVMSNTTIGMSLSMARLTAVASRAWRRLLSSSV